MSRVISDLFSKIEIDPWRQKVGFSEELELVHNSLQEIGNSEEGVLEILNKWLQKYQPCLFGRLAAKLGLLSYCILTEDDLNGDDENIQAKIQTARTNWTKEGYQGKKSGFILFVKSQKLAFAIPNEILMSLSKKICSYYLLEEIEEDLIYTDEIFLEKPGSNHITWKWHAGVNYFCANADNRWWQDHRIPGGLAFSVNSVGHMAKTCGIAKVINEMNKILGITDESFIESKVDSLDQALEFAMRTIALASNSVSGKATELLSLSETGATQTCPIEIPKPLVGKDCRHYKGYYHTDVTIPSEYFIPDVERPKSCKAHTLDFTYMYDSDLKNPDYITMGTGRRIRNSNNKKARKPNPKTNKTFPIEENINAGSRLYKAITS